MSSCFVNMAAALSAWRGSGIVGLEGVCGQFGSPAAAGTGLA